ncbi:MAG: winged helix-turn-helix transcriptional regulator [Gammaproteobacteria bacterium]|nr:winged helix-turn-helix transcriptional regulator [Gammaproteobacteria bacterium]
MQYDVANHLIKRDEQEYKLDPIINSLLQYFLANANRLVTRQEINQHVWPNICVSDDAINRAISVLRKSLSDERDKFLVTVRGEGYRFLNPDLINIMHSGHLANQTTQVTTSNTQTIQSSKERPGNKAWQTKLIVLLTIACTVLLAIIWQKNLISSDNLINNSLDTSIDPITITVSPFSSIGNRPYNASFDKGLLNEILMELSVSPEVDVSESEQPIRESLNEQSYSLSGTIDFKPNGAKVIVKLSNIRTQRFYPAIFFVKSTDDKEDNIQSLIAKNIAATVRLRTLHGSIAANYESLLNKVSPLDIEKLFIARSELIKHEASAGNALRIIEELMQKHPEISEIKGAFAFAFNLSNINLWSYQELENNIKMSQKVLAAAPANYDALVSLFYSYALHPHYRFKAFETAEQLTSNYPDDLGAWYAQLYINTSTFMPCDKINQNILETNAQNVFSKAQVEVLRRVLNACHSNVSHHQLVNDLKDDLNLLRRTNPQLAKQKQNILYKLFAFFPLRVDEKLAADREHLRRAPRNSYRYNLLEALLMLNQDVMAKTLFQQFEGTTAGEWLSVSQMLTEIEDLDVPSLELSSSKANDELIQQNQSVLLPITTALLIKRAQNWSAAQRQAYFSRLLDSLPNYSMNLDSIEHSIAVIAAQYFAEKTSQSESNAATLFGYLTRYAEQQPESFKFWGLAKYQLITGLYCGASCPDFSEETQSQLMNAFYSDEAYWTHNKTMLSIYLLPFTNKDSVKDYLARIDNDVKRAASELMF